MWVPVIPPVKAVRERLASPVPAKSIYYGSTLRTNLGFPETPIPFKGIRRGVGVTAVYAVANAMMARHNPSRRLPADLGDVDLDDAFIGPILLRLVTVERIP